MCLESYMLKEGVKTVYQVILLKGLGGYKKKLKADPLEIQKNIKLLVLEILIHYFYNKQNNLPLKSHNNH